MINWNFFSLPNILTIAAIVLLTRIVFTKAVNSLDGRASTSTDS